MIFAGILAGGIGSRMENATQPKQFLEVSGVPILIRTLNTFLSIKQIDKIIISINIDWVWKYEEILDTYKIDRNKVILANGGNTRFTSLINIAKKAKELNSDNNSIIITHDCARLFVSKKIIENNISAMKKYNIVTTSLPVIDTVLSSNDGKSTTEVLDRSKLFNDQGPQTFFVNTFLDYIAKLPEERYPEFIEAGKLFLEHGEKIGIIEGSRYNFKITNDFDLKYAEFILKEGYIK